MNGIGVREAAAKYKVPATTISLWTRHRMIRVVREAERRGQPVLLFEPDVAALAADYTPGKRRRRAAALETLAS